MLTWPRPVFGWPIIIIHRVQTNDAVPQRVRESACFGNVYVVIRANLGGRGQTLTLCRKRHTLIPGRLGSTHHGPVYGLVWSTGDQSMQTRQAIESGSRLARRLVRNRQTLFVRINVAKQGDQSTQTKSHSPERIPGS